MREDFIDISRLADGEAYYHVTVLSNFARAYDKYSRTYSKSAIPESTYPGQFYLLGKEAIGIGIRKASQLLVRLAIPGNQLIILQTRFPAAEVKANERNGPGSFVPQHFIKITGVYLVDAGNDWRESTVEEMMAASLRLLNPQFIPFADLQPRSVSLLPVALGCEARCAFCFSKASASADQDMKKLDMTRVRQVLDAAAAHGAGRAVITGGGEPGLYPRDRLLHLIKECAARFPKTVLISNGYFLAKQEDENRRNDLLRLDNAGLAVLALSRHHHDPVINSRIMNLDTGSERVTATWRQLRENLRLKLRFICVLQKRGVNSARAIGQYLTWATGQGVDEICFKELYFSTSVESAYYSYAANQWSLAHQVPLRVVLEFAAMHRFEKVDELPWGAPVFRGHWNGKIVQIAAYTEPSLFWERTHGIARSWNLMADGTCLASLEDRSSTVLEEDHEL